MPATHLPEVSTPEPREKKTWLRRSTRRSAHAVHHRDAAPHGLAHGRIVTVAFLGAAIGVAFWGWGVFYNGPVTALKIGYAPLMGLLVGPWFLAGVVGGLVRAATRSGPALRGRRGPRLDAPGHGVGGDGARVRHPPGARGRAGLRDPRLPGVRPRCRDARRDALGAAGVGLRGRRRPGILGRRPVLSVLADGGGWYAEWVVRDKLVYLGAMVVSGAVLAGLVGWLLVRALARAGALSAFPAGQEHRESRAV